jgi:hypothetical protein
LDPILPPTLFEILDLLASKSGALTLEDLNVKRRVTKRRFAEIGRVLEGFGIAHREEDLFVPDADLKTFVAYWETADLEGINDFFRRYQPYDKFLRFLEKEKCIHVIYKKGAKVEPQVGPQLIRNVGLLLFNTKSKCQSDLNDGKIKEDLRKEFKANGISLSQTVEVKKAHPKKGDNKWLLIDNPNNEKYTIKEQANNLNICAESTFVAVETFKWWGLAVGQIYVSHIGDGNIYWGGESPNLDIFEDSLIDHYAKIRPLDGFANIGKLADRVCRELHVAFIEFERLFVQLCRKRHGSYRLSTSLARPPTCKSPVQTLLPRSTAKQLADNFRTGKPIEWTDKRLMENGVMIGGRSVKLVKIQMEEIK